MGDEELAVRVFVEKEEPQEQRSSLTVDGWAAFLSGERTRYETRGVTTQTLAVALITLLISSLNRDRIMESKQWPIVVLIFVAGIFVVVFFASILFNSLDKRYLAAKDALKVIEESQSITSKDIQEIYQGSLKKGWSLSRLKDSLVMLLYRFR